MICTYSLPGIIDSFSSLKQRELFDHFFFNGHVHEHTERQSWSGAQTQLMRTYLGRPEFGSCTRQNAYMTFPLFNSSTNSSSPPSGRWSLGGKKKPKKKHQMVAVVSCVTAGFSPFPNTGVGSMARNALCIYSSACGCMLTRKFLRNVW